MRKLKEFAPWLDDEDTPGSGQTAETQSDESQTEGDPKPAAEETPPTEERPKFQGLSKDEYERRQREREAQARLDKLEREAEEQRRAANANANKPDMPATGDPIKDAERYLSKFSQQDIENDDSLQQMQINVRLQKAAIEEARAAREEAAGFRNDLKESQQRRAQREAAKETYEHGMGIAELAMQSSAAYAGNSATHKARQKDFMARVDAAVQSRINAGWDRAAIDDYLRAELPGFIESEEIKYGDVTPGGVKPIPNNANPTRDQVIERDNAAKASINATGTAPPSVSRDDGKIGPPPKPADLIRKFRERSASASANSF